MSLSVMAMSLSHEPWSILEEITHKVSSHAGGVVFGGEFIGIQPAIR